MILSTFQRFVSSKVASFIGHDPMFLLQGGKQDQLDLVSWS